MKRGITSWLAATTIVAALGAAPALAHEGHGAEEANSGAIAEAPHVFERMEALAGEWVAAEDTPSFKKGELVSRYALTAGGTALVDTLFPGKPNEMTTVYHRDGLDLVATHYCAGGNQPHLRAKAPAVHASVIELAFDGGTNLDARHDSHMHSERIQFVAPDEIIADWQGWSGGKPNGAPARFHLLRKRAEEGTAPAAH